MEIDRTSCSRFWANQFRVLLTAAAYVLMQELRLAAAGTNCARAQVWTLRERFLKLGARVMASVRRMVVHLPQSFPFLATFRIIALELGASPGRTASLHKKTFRLHDESYRTGKPCHEKRSCAAAKCKSRSSQPAAAINHAPVAVFAISCRPKAVQSVFVNNAG